MFNRIINPFVCSGLRLRPNGGEFMAKSPADQKSDAKDAPNTAKKCGTGKKAEQKN